MKNIKLSKLVIGLSAVSIVLLFMSLKMLFVYGTQQDREITIKKMERVMFSNNSRYLIYAEDGVYENVDSILRMKFNSADVYGQLQNGKTYMCDTYGWRVPFFSMYPNIVSCREKQY